MFDKVINLVRAAAVTSLPTGVFSADRILHDAVDLNATPGAVAARVISISLELGQAFQRSISRRPRFEVDGFLVMTSYEPSGTGDGTQLSHLRTMALYLNNRKLTDTDVSVRLFSPVAQNGARSGSHWVKILRVPFRAQYYYPA